MNIFKSLISAKKAEVGPNAKASISRRVQRAGRVKSAMVRAARRGDNKRFDKLEAEFNSLMGEFSQEKNAIAELLK